MDLEIMSKRKMKMKSTLLIVNILFAVASSRKPRKPFGIDGERRCVPKKYMSEVTMPGTFDDDCKRRVQLTKCEGYCKSMAIPVSVPPDIRWDYRCKCCQPSEYEHKEIIFPKCGGSVKKKDIKSCKCLPC